MFFLKSPTPCSCQFADEEETKLKFYYLKDENFVIEK
jgi:hypothetical protein